MLLLPIAAIAMTNATLHLREVPFTHVRIQDKFWAPRRETNRKVSLVHSLDMLDKYGYMKNFELAAQGKHEGYTGPVYMDSDVYKTLEAVSYSLATDPDEKLSKRLDGIIANLAAAQGKDGYLNTYFTVKEPGKRWTNLRDWHELYCAGHLFEAAVAHFQATGKKSLLNIATKYADYIGSVFGEGKRAGYCGHPEIELALFKLYRATGERRYLNLSKFFLVHRGEHFFAKEHGSSEGSYDGGYWQDDVPIKGHMKVKGHAVRAAYLMSGAVDVGGETNDEELLAMVDRVWQNTNERNTYVTGGIGPSASNEGFTTDFDLPNLTAYQETCASVALAMWNHRMNLLYGDSKYADCVERSLYNAVLAGVSLTGDKFFYVNPLESKGGHHRSEWFSCACCPPNETRTLAALGSYAYATGDKSLWVNLFIQGGGEANIGSHDVKWDVKTEYPWDGSVSINMRSNWSGKLCLRNPGWCLGASVDVNTKRMLPSLERGYFVIDRDWKAGDEVLLTLPMPVRRIAADPRVKADVGQVAIARGPLIYCLEGCDNGAPLSTVWLPSEAVLTTERRPHSDWTVIRAEGRLSEGDWSGGLYDAWRPLPETQLEFVPYYGWDNRRPGEMRVWIPFSPQRFDGGPERRAVVSISFANDNCQPSGVNDGVEPRRSSDPSPTNCHWWPHKGGTEWVQYEWPRPANFGASRVFWYDDTGRGECKVPASWRLLYLKDDKWLPVELVNSDYDAKLDTWCRIKFKPVKTVALRLEVTMQDGWAAGVHEWKVDAEDD